MAGPRVVIFYEDKTAGGLHTLIAKMVRKYRTDADRERFSYFYPLAMKSNTKLIAECSNFERMRFHGPHHADHVVVVIDAYEVEKVVPSAPGPPNLQVRADPDAFSEYCQRLEDAVKEFMRALALGRMTEEARRRNEGRFHPNVLFWERESVFLAGSPILRESRGIRFPDDKVTPDGILRTRCPTAIVEEAWRDHAGGKYSKQINGPQLFGDLAADEPRWPMLMERLACLRTIVEGLVAL